MFKVDGLRRKLWAVILARGEQRRMRARARARGIWQYARGGGEAKWQVKMRRGSRNLPRCNLAGKAYDYLARFNIIILGVHVAAFSLLRQLSAAYEMKMSKLEQERERNCDEIAEHRTARTTGMRLINEGRKGGGIEAAKITLTANT